MTKKFKYTKPQTYLVIMLSVFLLFMICTALILPGLAKKMEILNRGNVVEEDKYTKQLRNLIENGGQVTLSDVFDDFEFKYAYVFNDSFLGGDKLKIKYNLDLSIDGVGSVDPDYIRRVVFVDENKQLVFNWEYDIRRVFILTGGYYITPATVIVKENVGITPLCVKFEGIADENYFGPNPEKSQEVFNASIAGLTKEALVEQNSGIDNTQCRYGEYNYAISTESEDKHQYLYRTTMDGKDAVLVLYSENGITSVSLGQEDFTIRVNVNVMIDGVLTNIPVDIAVDEYDRDTVWVQNRISQ